MKYMAQPGPPPAAWQGPKGDEKSFPKIKTTALLCDAGCDI